MESNTISLQSYDQNESDNNQSSSLHILFLNVIDQVMEQVKQDNFSSYTEICNNLMASEFHGIHFFSNTHIILHKHNNVVLLLKYLRFLFTWSNHSILRALISCNSKALQILDDFDSLLDPFKIIASYPIPTFSQDMIPSETSDYALLAIKCKRELWKFSLQDVFNIQSFIIEQCNITQYCLQLLAVTNDPTTFYWTIPKCIVELIKTTVLYSELLCPHEIFEVSVCPKQIPNNDDSMGSFDFTNEKSLTRTHKVIMNARLYFVMIEYTYMYIETTD